MPTLRDAVLSRVALMLTDPKLPAAELSPLKFLSPGLADAVLAALIRQKKLDIHSLRRLAARCQLENVAMDSYRLATDSVLAILGTAGVRRLTLRGCSYVTDDGIKALAPLTKTLQHLDLSNVKVTDKSAPTLAAMRGLVHLDLSSTKITTAGLRTIAKGLGVDGSGESALETLMLAHCPGIMGNTIFEDLKPLRNLETLSLVSAQITSPLKPPTGPQSEFYPHLRVLDVSRTAVSDEDVRRIVSGFSDLKELDLKGCSGVTAVGMQNIAKSLKHLTAISFPTRDLPLDLILPALAQNRVPLAGLDLENASDISDVGLAAIAGFAPTLKTLSLAGIKTISIRALTSLLSQLDLVSLDLDRVACLSPPFLDPSNEEEAFFAASIRRYAGLESLSVAQTGVGDAALEVWNGGAGTVPGTAHVASMSTSPAYARPDAEREAQFKRILRKLNLNRCAGVTDKGVACLAGFLNLSFLNLDHTGCTQACLDSLKDLANLQKPRLLGIPPPGQVPRQEPEAQGQEFHDDFAWAGPGISLAGQRTEARAANAGQQHHAQNGENGDQDEEDEDDEMESDGEGMEMDGMEL
ncbi:hypothetical protein DFJ74DRAFT_659928 [Hyaloraphidium curvatum]|nr:hypothetical protein DFJ74DRAFT_659928 [Hyaloraphidium curvatum]